MRDLPYFDENLPINDRIDDLISRMSAEEKISQLTNFSDELEELEIPQYDWWNEALHGVARAGYATVFPQAIGMAAAFDDALIYEIACAISEEARAKYNKAKRENDFSRYTGLTFWSPNINIFRDPRWGRGQETYGEDPYLTGTLGTAFVKGLQQWDGKHLKAAACAKHFAAHSGPENLRHEFDARVSKKDLFETYLPAFEMCVREGRVEAVMGAYNRLNGAPCCADKWLLKDILRDEWGFEGHVVSDCGAIADIHEHHKVTQSPAESAALALKNGCDLNCGIMFRFLNESYEMDTVSDSDLDNALRHILGTRFRLGMLDRGGSVSYSSIGEEKIACEEHKKLALRAAEKSFVLLKNNGILPLSANPGKIAVIGPNADSGSVLLGNYNGTPTETHTVYRGLRDYIGEENVFYAKGCNLMGESDPDMLRDALAAAKKSDLIVAVIGLDPSLEGEEGDVTGGDRADIELPGCQQRLLEELKKTGKPLIAAVAAGSALALNWADENADAVIYIWYPGELGGKALARVLFGEVSPSGRLPVTFFRSAGDLPEFTDYSMKGRTYRYLETEPLYPFGYGLSYTRFEYSGLKAEKADGGIKLTLKVKNTGGFDADEKVQVYISPENPEFLTPRHELKAFASVFLEAGEERELSFTLPPRAFTLINPDGERVGHAGGFIIYAGGGQPGGETASLRVPCHSQL